LEICINEIIQKTLDIYEQKMIGLIAGR